MAEINSSLSPVVLIRRRLFILLLSAFTVVVLLTILLVVGSSVVLLSTMQSGNPYYEPPLVSRLEAYYLVNGSWTGVERILEGNLESDQDMQSLISGSVLLDETGKVLFDHAQVDPSQVGTAYIFKLGDTQYILIVNGKKIGTLVLSYLTSSHPLRVILRLMAPVMLLSFFLALLTLLIGFLLVRRVVNPLADVIAAARSVASGDLSARVQVRGPDDLKALNDSFNHMAESLEEADRQRRDMLADIAHELRTPLTVIRGRLEGILDGIYPADEGHIALVLEQTYLLERLVDDLRILTLLESRQMRFDKCEFDLGEMAGRVVELFTPEAEEKAIAIGLEVESGLPEVTADPQRVEQVLSNLVNNALSYIPQGGHVTVRIQARQPGVIAEVIDDGPGISAEELPHIFDRFWRGEKSRGRASGGAGLGLAIARQLVEAQGGTIYAENNPEAGLRIGFWFS